MRLAIVSCTTCGQLVEHDPLADPIAAEKRRLYDALGRVLRRPFPLRASNLVKDREFIGLVRRSYPGAQETDMQAARRVAAEIMSWVDDGLGDPVDREVARAIVGMDQYEACPNIEHRTALLMREHGISIDTYKPRRKPLVEQLVAQLTEASSGPLDPFLHTPVPQNLSTAAREIPEDIATALEHLLQALLHLYCAAASVAFVARTADRLRREGVEVTGDAALPLEDSLLVEKLLLQIGAATLARDHVVGTYPEWELPYVPFAEHRALWWLLGTIDSVAPLTEDQREGIAAYVRAWLFGEDDPEVPDPELEIEVALSHAVKPWIREIAPAATNRNDTLLDAIAAKCAVGHNMLKAWVGTSPEAEHNIRLMWMAHIVNHFSSDDESLELDGKPLAAVALAHLETQGDRLALSPVLWIDRRWSHPGTQRWAYVPLAARDAMTVDEARLRWPIPPPW